MSDAGWGRAPARPYDAVVAGDGGALVADPWERWPVAGADPDRGEPPHVVGRDGTAGDRAGHPLADVLPLLHDTLVAIADEARHRMIVTDAQGRVLWWEGTRDVLRRAGRIGFAEGARGIEDGAGADAVDTAPVAGAVVRTRHGWTCGACPVHDPDTGAVIGAVGVTGPDRSLHPTTLALVAAAARLAEGHLAAQQALRNARVRSMPVANVRTRAVRRCPPA